MSSNRDFAFGFRIAFFVVALLIIVASTWFSNRLARQMAREEQAKMELWAEAIRLLAQEAGEEDVHSDYSLTLKILEGNTSIPVVLVNEQGEIQSYANLRLSPKDPESDLARRAASIIGQDRRIDVKLSEDITQYVYYADSLHLKQLKYFPYVQLAVMFLFLVVTLLSLSISKRAEQNRVWVGLSKETAHQLGTPISSLLAWEELLKLKDIDPSLLTEIEKDTRRLQTIAERFSKIGSEPAPEPQLLAPAIENAVNYIRGRSSQKVVIDTHFPDEELCVCLNSPLFEWVIENLCKNAIDAMDGDGRIDITAGRERGQVFIDVQDTGKGIAKNRLRQVFKPGYTTKARGWGLGLSLARRIVEQYHHGKIFVKQSELGQGTTFRILMKQVKNQ
ncbi:MAG: HAMP domain-containing histidine kinase [Bacteroidales bacterium]|nr:HAMP domain-containing histidine kinase [Bacteroidales bacterium]